MSKKVMARMLGGLAALLLMLVAASCKDEGYESGDDELSYLQADFALVYTDSGKAFVRANTDSGNDLLFDEPQKYNWADTPDSVYRGLVYYNNKVEDGRVEVVGVTQVLFAWPKKPTDFKEMYTDPLTVESAWLSRGNSFLNLGMFVKTGVADDVDARQKIGIVADTVIAHPNGHKNRLFTIFHAQNGVPTYYSTRLWMTVALGDIEQHDTITLQANTFDGLLTRTIVAE